MHVDKPVLQPNQNARTINTKTGTTRTTQFVGHVFPSVKDPDRSQQHVAQCCPNPPGSSNSQSPAAGAAQAGAELLSRIVTEFS